MYTEGTGREDADQTIYVKCNDWTNGKEWIYREETRRKRFKKSRIYFTEKGKSISEDCHKRFAMIQQKLQEYFTKEEQEELDRLLNKFCDCLDEQTEILKKERKERSDA